jgi:hypothetical protein
VDPVPDQLLLRKSGSAGNRTRDLWICSHKLWPLDHRVRIKISGEETYGMTMNKMDQPGSGRHQENRNGGFHHGENLDFGHLGCDTVQSGRRLPMFQSKILPPSSWYMKKAADTSKMIITYQTTCRLPLYLARYFTMLLVDYKVLNGTMTTSVKITGAPTGFKPSTS